MVSFMFFKGIIEGGIHKTLRQRVPPKKGTMAFSVKKNERK